MSRDSWAVGGGAVPLDFLGFFAKESSLPSLSVFRRLLAAGLGRAASRALTGS